MSHWFEGVADHLGDAYLRYSFTWGTVSEVAALVDVLDLGPGCRTLPFTKGRNGPGQRSHSGYDLLTLGGWGARPAYWQ